MNCANTKTIIDLAELHMAAFQVCWSKLTEIVKGGRKLLAS